MIDLNIRTQPDDETCGPTSLHAIYHYFGLTISLKDVIDTMEHSLSGGTLAPLLGKHALSHGFDATIYVNQLELFDPTWFNKSKASNEALMIKLKSQDKFKQSKNYISSSKAYQDFLELGGEIRFKTVDAQMLKEYFNKNVPILTGLNSTYLYRTSREMFTSSGESFYDDIQGSACGHFVVLCGYHEKRRHVIVADPFRENPISKNNFYKVSISRLINAIMLGAQTYDAALLIITPKEKEKEAEEKKAGEEVKDAKKKGKRSTS
ncbi:MAG: peptidase-C39 like family protein [Legionellales bacterium RIFCSPHIGHO2_12_FULL_37_14]|nr:MAG: peptidase-C39 like family protein [Legionellales bacterium RIFCSPHIGHO2_12_FULL_37_14]